MIKRKISIVCVCILIISFIAVIVAMDKFSTANPFAAVNGLLQITFTKKEYVQIQNSPRVVIAKSEGNSYERLIQFMDYREYTLLEDKQEGAMSTFRNRETGNMEYVIFSVNQYYSLWVWKE